ncbi:DUF2314 domain-containing protein [Piscinibacter terrae]|nr:DUF2314 domain-containing protein [Albitalea terrae]
MGQVLRRALALIGLVWCLLSLNNLVLAGPGSPVASGPLAAGSIKYQFAIYYIGTPSQAPMTVFRSQLKLTPNAPSVVTTIPDEPTAALVRAKLDDSVQEHYAPPSLEMLHYFGRGLTREQAVAMQAARHALILDFAHPRSMSSSSYRLSLQLTEQVARATGGLVWDEETREVFTVDEWHKRRLDSWEGETPDVLKHTVIHAYKGDKLVRAITLGMAKFGLPDVVVSDFPWSSNRSMGNLINLLAQAMVEGASVGSKGFYDLDIRSIKHASVRQSQMTTLKAGSEALAHLVLVEGTPEDGDPRNRLVEIRFDRATGPDRYAKQEFLLGSLFGTEDSVAYVKHSEELLAVSRAAKARLPALREALNNGLQPGEHLLVKAPFKTPDGGQEWMWVEVTAWEGEVIRGLLKNEPVQIPSLHAGQMVKVNQQEVFDYLRRDGKGREEGNETSKILQRMQDAKR